MGLSFLDIYAIGVVFPEVGFQLVYIFSEPIVTLTLDWNLYLKGV